MSGHDAKRVIRQLQYQNNIKILDVCHESPSFEAMRIAGQLTHTYLGLLPPDVLRLVSILDSNYHSKKDLCYLRDTYVYRDSD